MKDKSNIYCRFCYFVKEIIVGPKFGDVRMIEYEDGSYVVEVYYNPDNNYRPYYDMVWSQYSVRTKDYSEATKLLSHAKEFASNMRLKQAEAIRARRIKRIILDK